MDLGYTGPWLQWTLAIAALGYNGPWLYRTLAIVDLGYSGPWLYRTGTITFRYSAFQGFFSVQLCTDCAVVKNFVQL